MIVHDGRRRTIVHDMSPTTAKVGEIAPAGRYFRLPCACGDPIDLAPFMQQAMQRHQRRPRHKAYRAHLRLVTT